MNIEYGEWILNMLILFQIKCIELFYEIQDTLSFGLPEQQPQQVGISGTLLYIFSII